MKLTYDIIHKKAKAPKWDEGKESFLISTVVHANDPLYQSQGLQWDGVGFKNEWFLKPKNPVWFRTGIVLADYDEFDINVSPVLPYLSVQDINIDEETNELKVQLVSFETVKIKTGDYILSLVVGRQVGESTDEEYVNEELDDDTDDLDYED